MIDGIPVGVLTPSALLGVVVLLILTGRLVPRSALVAERKRAEAWEQFARDSLGITGRVVGHAEVTHKLLEQLPNPAREDEEAP